MDAKNELHPFERAGLGLAPFRFVGMEVKEGPITTTTADGFTLTVGSPGQPMGCCDYCHTGIKDCYQVADRDGKLFVVGCDCVKKLYQANNRKMDPVAAGIERARRNVQRARRHKAADEKIRLGLDLIAANRSTFEAMPHPIEWRAEQGDTYNHYITWMLANSGRAGKIKTIKAVKAILKGEG